MKTQHISHLLSGLCLLLLVGCNLPAGFGGAGPRTWIDSPLDGTTLPLGTFVVRSHAASDGGTARAALLVNGAQVRTDSAADSGASLIEFSQAWTPPGPGVYVLQVVSSDHAGNEGHSNEVHVIVGELTEATATPAPVTGTPGTATLTPTITATTSGAPSITFNVPANCREGPSTQYAVVTAFLAGQQVVIEGRNADNSWFWVLIPGDGHCWVSATTGVPQGPYASTDVIQPPPPPVITTEAPPQAATTEAPPQPPQAPPAPAGFGVTELVCTSEAYTVRLSWKNVNGEDGFRIYRDGGLIASLGADQTSYDDTPGDYESHDYRVEAFNGGGANSTGTQSSTGCLF